MRTAAAEHLSHAQVMSRLSATFSALIHEQVEVVRRFLDTDPSDLDSSDLGTVVDLAVRLVERSADWLELTEVATLTLGLRESLSQMGQLRPTQRQETMAHCRVALDAEEKLAEKLRTEGFGSLIQHAGMVGDAVDQLRANINRAKAQALAASRGVIDESTPDVSPQDNLLALTFEIKSALLHQNDRIGSMGETLGEALRAVQATLNEWDIVVKGVERRRVSGETGEADALDGGRALTIHQELQSAASGMRTLSHELNQLLGLQYSLERRARDLDEHLLWEFLDPLDRFVDDMYTAVSHRASGGTSTVLTVQTGGVGFEPEIGSILLPLVLRLLGSAEPLDPSDNAPELRVAAVREGLEARIAIEGPFAFDPETLVLLGNAVDGLAGFLSVSGGSTPRRSVRFQFPMARSLRSFLIVEVSGHRMALPWSAIESIHASVEEMRTAGQPEDALPRIHWLDELFTREESAEPVERPYGPVAVIRSGRGSVVVGFDRIVWRENARLSVLPRHLGSVSEVLGGIVGPDSSVTLVLHPGPLVRKLSGPEGAQGRVDA